MIIKIKMNDDHNDVKITTELNSGMYSVKYLFLLASIKIWYFNAGW